MVERRPVIAGFAAMDAAGPSDACDRKAYLKHTLLSPQPDQGGTPLAPGGQRRDAL